jgi:hypothetical protein
MYRARRTKWIAIAATALAGSLYQTTSGCADFALLSGVSAFNVCSVINCTGSSFFDFCQPTPLFVDCPNFAADENP